MTQPLRAWSSRCLEGTDSEQTLGILGGVCLGGALQEAVRPPPAGAPTRATVRFASSASPAPILLRAPTLPHPSLPILRHPLPSFPALGTIPWPGQFTDSNPPACSHWLGDRHVTQSRLNESLLVPAPPLFRMTSPESRADAEEHCG